MKVNAQLTYRRKQLAAELSYIFPVVEVCILSIYEIFVIVIEECKVLRNYFCFWLEIVKRLFLFICCTITEILVDFRSNFSVDHPIHQNLCRTQWPRVGNNIYSRDNRFVYGYVTLPL